MEIISGVQIIEMFADRQSAAVFVCVLCEMWLSVSHS